MEIMLHAVDGHRGLLELLVHVLPQVFGLLLHFLCNFILGFHQGVFSCILNLLFEQVLGQCEVYEIHPVWLDLLLQVLAWGYFISQSIWVFFPIEDLIEFSHEIAIVYSVHSSAIFGLKPRLQDRGLLRLQLVVDHLLNFVLGCECFLRRDVQSVLRAFLKSGQLEIILE